MSRRVIFLLAVLAMCGSQCAKRETPVSPQEGHADPTAATSKDTVRLTADVCEMVGIKVEKVGYKPCRSVLKAMAKILAPQPQTAIVSHALAARVGKVHVKIGDWVKQGQPLVTLESPEVADAKSEFYKAIADRELARLTFAREEQLLKKEVGLKKNYLAAESACKIAEANAEVAHKKLHVLGFTEEQVQEITDTHQINPSITLQSPIDGKVVANKAILGAQVDQMTEIMTIINPTLLWVDAEIYEKDIAKVKVGQGAEIVVPAYPGKVFEGKISYIGDVVDEQTRTIVVRAEVKNEDNLLKQGMFANVDILLNGICKMLVVSSAAVLEEGREKTVFVKDKDCFRRRLIQTGTVEGDYQQVVGGLKAGEEVVVEGNHELRSKLKEEVLKAAHVH